ncbi:MAG: TonB-dependent receptor [Desulfobulbaceae bacterium]|uniref:TonB-dependent receptor n=1 Tax=Candidatus Desulfobia pelagia TaxID=2841692 RepID=A0A8J6TDE4_9BACT|nr:TonB-dependent receptor [Candidatus Desulfobia pelagia]
MKKRMSIPMALLFTAALNSTAQAAEDNTVTTAIDEVVVTATRTETDVKKIGGASITVITQDEILAKQQSTVQEVLKGIPGLDIISNGGMGTSTSIFLRGSDSKNTLILVDGIMFNDPSLNNRQSDIANLTTDNIERIEIVRGPMSVLYGSNAAAGVINIITKKGTGVPKTTLGFEAGSYNTWKIHAGNSGSTDRLDYSLNVSHLNSKGFSTANNDNDDIPHAGNTSEEDGYENSSISAKANYEITPNFDLVASMRYMDSEIEEDDYGSGYIGDRFTAAGPPLWISSPDPTGSKKMHTDSEQYLGRVDAKNKFSNDFLNSNFYYQFSRHDRQSYNNDGNKSFDFTGKSQEAGWLGTFAVSDNNDLTIGTSFFEEKMKSKSSDIKKDADITSVWAQEQVTLPGNIEIIAALRYDDHDSFGSKTTYRIAPSYFTDFGTLLKASFATGFRAPSLYELYDSTYGNENLDPEKSKGWDVGFEQEVADGTVLFGATYFALTFNDRIGYDSFTFQSIQVDGDTKTKGVETFIQWQPSETLSFLANYTYTDTKDPDGERLVRRPMHKISLGTQYRYKKALFNCDIRWVDERDTSSFETDLNGNPVETLDSYTLVNIAASYDLNETVQLQARIDNFFDEEYEEVWSYATPGFSGYAGIKMTF